MNKIVKDTIIMTLITVIAGVCLALVYDVTKAPIAEAREKQKQEAYAEVFKEADSFEEVKNVNVKDGEKVLGKGGYENNTIDEVAAAVDKNGDQIGYVVTVTSHQGYGGDIQFTVGIAEDGTVTGLAMLAIAETAGLGMEAAKPDFMNQFKDKKAETFTYTKNGAAADDEINALSGATITTNAVTDGVNAAIYFFENTIEGGN